MRRFFAEFEIRTCALANPDVYRARILVSVPLPGYQDPTRDLNRESAKQFCQVLLDQSREPLRLCGFFGKKATPTSIGGSNKHKDEGPKTRGLSDSDSASPALYS
jgi:hypothetical protein